MSRLIFLFAIVAVAYWLLRSYVKRPPSQPATKAPEEMVRCAQCGVHIPKSESILAEEMYFCTAAHQHAHSQRNE